MEYVTTHYIEKALGVSYGQAARWIRKGRISGVMKTSPGSHGHYRIPKDVADAFIESFKLSPIEERKN